MTQWMKESIKTSGTVDKSWKLHHVPVMSPLKPGKNNNYPRSWYKNILIWDNIYSHIYWFIAAAGPFAFLQSQCQLYAVFEPYSRVLCETYLYQMYLILPSVSLGSLKIQQCLSIITTWPESFGLKFLCTHNNNNKKKDRVRRLFSLSVLHCLSSLPFFAWLTIHPTVFLRLKSRLYDDQSNPSTSNREKPNIFNRSGFTLRGFVVL